MSSGPTILLSAGEPSGDLHGGAVARALKERWPTARLYGLGGPRMADAGVELLADVRDLAVMGFVEVAARLPYFLRLLRRLGEELRRRSTDLVIPIDYPGLNMRLARMAHGASVPVLYYIAPQVWAWHVSRVRQLARYTDRMAVILPFEERLFREAGADARYVGHPLLDDSPEAISRADFLASLGLEDRGPILALFPGSRVQEVTRHLPVFVEAAALVRQRRPEVQPVIAAAPTVPAHHYAGVPFRTTTAGRVLLQHASTALVKSGTTTLETALAGVPMVIAYRTHPVTFQIARRLVRVDHIGLVNLVAGERIAPEFVQDAATPAALAEAVASLLPGGTARASAEAGLARVRAILGEGRGTGSSVAARVCDLAAELLAA